MRSSEMSSRKRTGAAFSERKERRRRWKHTCNLLDTLNHTCHTLTILVDVLQLVNGRFDSSYSIASPCLENRLVRNKPPREGGREGGREEIFE